MKIVCLCAAIAATCALPLLAGSARAETRVVAYVPNWVDLAAFAATIDYAKITHINVAFENPADDGGSLSFNPADDALIAKAHANRVKALVSIGGGSASNDKALVNRFFKLISAPYRTAFASKLADYVQEHKFDGLDVDLEGPAINEDYGPFIAELSRALKLRGSLLTAALSQGYGGSRVPISVFRYFDFINIMAYDGAGYWDPNSPGQHASLDFAKSSVAYWLDRGLPRSKAVLGVPFYGYGFGDAFRKSDYPYWQIVSDYPGAENADQAGKTIWYNGIPTARAKARFVVEARLGGVMVWSLDYDVRGERSLLSALYTALHTGLRQQNGAGR